MKKRGFFFGFFLKRERERERLSEEKGSVEGERRRERAAGCWGRPLWRRPLEELSRSTPLSPRTWVPVPPVPT